MTPDRKQYPRRSERTDASAWGEKRGGYRSISERIMRELPFFNKALRVKAIGFRA
ncbi:[NiFe]-hydrogenase assembly chaperone HybE [Bradyrhizobium yuanmingense]|uniref:[NiFe]-hydrogenase assembly chaperone HybE n=1 Tax=Bradyrhizobium yuanmingense TaxID=108015 RepID=UPI0030B8EFCD